MARSDFSDDFKRISSKETNNQNSTGRGGAGPRKLDGLATPRSNPMKGGGINRAPMKSKLQ